MGKMNSMTKDASKIPIAFTAIAFDENLPINQKRPAIMDLIANHSVVVIAGETGSGKTTQIPKICLSMGLGETGIIGHTQPRRIAARTVAARIAEELKTPLGQVVGYKIRFSDKTATETAVKVMTDGILLAEIKNDPWLKRYSTLIIDEAHERSLNIDLILGYLKYLLLKRPDLKVIITSATIDPEKFSKFFNQAPILEVSGRTYPVDVWYRPLVGSDEEKSIHQIEGILQAVDEVSRIGRGDILVFLSGEREIRETFDALRKHQLSHTEILPLFARLNAQQQNRVFEPAVGRRIILATNVAETSLTVPGIQFVIDTGLARISRYNYRNQVQRLPIEAISKASANQRKGRCGRVMAGVCVRLYSEEDFETRPEFTEPEILRTSLAGVILHMLAVGLSNIEIFPFLDPPDIRHIREGFRLLEQLGAITPNPGPGLNPTLTSLGAQLSQLPLDPVLGTIILSAAKQRCLLEILIIASALSLQDPRERPLEKQAAADEKHKPYQEPGSDFLAYLKLWETIHKQREALSNNQFKTWCRSEFLSFSRIQDWRDIHQQLSHLITEMGFRINQTPASYADIHMALMAGLLSNIGSLQEKNSYLGLRNTKFSIFPGSVLFEKPPKWLLAFEVVETQRLYARTTARILPEWIETIAGHLFKIHYDNPHWERKAKQVMALAKANFYGLTIYENRKVIFGRIDPSLSREIFIRSALVEGEYDTKAPFFHHNRALIESVETLEHKARRRDILIDEQDLFEFYDQKIPEEMVSGPQFEQWLKTTDQSSLFLTESALIRQNVEGVTEQQYPESMQINGIKLFLTYHFAPGSLEDGVTVTIPTLALKQLTLTPFEWLVPGLLKEKIAAMIKSLAKPLRRNFVPVPEFAEALFNRLMISFREGHLKERLARELSQMTGISITKADFSDDLLPLHLKMRFRVINTEGKTISESRDLLALKETTPNQMVSQTINEKLTDWPNTNIEKQIISKQNGIEIPGYPALVDKQDFVELQIMPSPEEAIMAHYQGVRRLLYLAELSRLKYLSKQFAGKNILALQFHPVGTKEDLLKDFLMAVIDKAFLNAPETAETETGIFKNLPRTPAEYQQCLALGKPKLINIANELLTIIGKILENYQKVKSLNLSKDAKEHLDKLIYPEFITNTPITWLKRIPIYLQAIEYRCLKLRESKVRDAELEKQIKPFWQRYITYIQDKNKAQEINTKYSEWLQYRWMMEEFRVSLFAQHLKTKMPISAKRLEEQWQKLGF
jgi:ATP-dependent helicase HrpA